MPYHRNEIQLLGAIFKPCIIPFGMKIGVLLGTQKVQRLSSHLGVYFFVIHKMTSCDMSCDLIFNTF
jgi:hypothetical protein